MEAGTLHRSLKEKQRQERADLILQAAEAIFTEKGYHEASMDEIAARVGVAKGTVYLYFPSKQDLVFALFKRELEEFLEVAKQVSSSNASAHEKLEHLLHYVYQGLPGQRTQLLLVLYTSMEVRQDLLTKKEQVRDLVTQLSELITAMLEEGKAAGEFDATIPTSVMLRIFFLLLSPHTQQQVPNAVQLSQDELATQLARVYFGGILSPH
jgi:TetR/AcrR family fatty acid metabolism transcriptional regulator